MNKLNKRDYFSLILLSLFVILVTLVITRGEYLYGSTTDWKDQHFLFAEYFRNLFYHTGNLIPQLALNIGGGQNIFNFAYYGLLNPIILISYLFPFIDMMHYVIISSILVVIISVILFYKWIKNNNFSSNVCLITTFIFLTASPLIFHSHRHIMFINYMPFLLLGLIGIDKYFRNKKFYLITISTALMIFTSYYYSVGGIVVLSIYYLYKYLMLNKKINGKDLMFGILKFAYFILLGVMIACILLLPVLATILSGRGTNIKDLSLSTIFIPKIDIGYILYNSYGIGLTSIAIISLVSLFFYKGKHNKFLVIILTLIFCFPLFVYLLNGTLYINAKALIPFLPLMCLIIGSTLTKIFSGDFPIKKITIFLSLLILVSYFMNSEKVFNAFLIDTLIVLGSIFLYKVKNKKILLYIPLSIISIINCFGNNLSDVLYSKEEYLKEHDKSINESINDLISHDQGFYRINNNLAPLSTSNKIYNINYYQSSIYSSTYNSYYNDFYANKFQNEISYRNSIINNENNNLLFQIYMGEKYIVTKNKPNLGYEIIKDNDNYQIYENKGALPIGYVTSNLMSYDDYDKLTYPYNVEALLNYAIIDKKIESDYNSKFEDYNISSLKRAFDDSDFNKEDDGYHFKLDESKSLNIPLENKIKNKILIISFDMKLSQSCSKGDTYIIINGIKNKLTCKSWKYHNNNYDFNYVLTTDEINDLNIKFSSGEFIIDNIKAYTLDYEQISNIKNSVNEFSIDRNSTKDNKIVGEVNATKDGYFVLKIPYDEAFDIYIDGYKTETLNVNSGFLGAKIESGKHNIEIVYHTPLLLLGKIVSLIGILLLITAIIISKHYVTIKNRVLNNKLVKFGIKTYKKYEEIINYLFMGGCTTIVSIGTYTICTSLFNIHYQISNIISWFFAVAFAFITNKLFVFKVKSKDNLLKEIYQFIKFRLLSLAIDMGTMYVLVDLIKMNDFIAKILVQVIVVALNYIFSKLFIFIKKDK